MLLSFEDLSTIEYAGLGPCRTCTMDLFSENSEPLLPAIFASIIDV